MDGRTNGYIITLIFNDICMGYSLNFLAPIAETIMKETRASFQKIWCLPQKIPH